MKNKTTEEIIGELNNIIANYFSENKFKSINNTDSKNEFIEVKINVLEKNSGLGFKNKYRSRILV